MVTMVKEPSIPLAASSATFKWWKKIPIMSPPWVKTRGLKSKRQIGKSSTALRRQTTFIAWEGRFTVISVSRSLWFLQRICWEIRGVFLRWMIWDREPFFTGLSMRQVRKLFALECSCVEFILALTLFWYKSTDESISSNPDKVKVSVKPIFWTFYFVLGSRTNPNEFIMNTS